MTDTEKRIAEIKARCDAATCGPWSWGPEHVFLFDPGNIMIADYDQDLGHVGIRLRGYGPEKAGKRPKGSQTANGDFIANSREDVPFSCPTLMPSPHR